MINELAAALVLAQAEMTGAKKDSNNPFFKSKYADLASVMEAIRPALSAHGLGFVQVAHDSENAAIIETVIVHSSGQTMSCGKVSVPVSKADAQGYGSAITYARRYSLQTAFGVPSVDDDGNAAAAASPKPILAAKRKAELTTLASSMIDYVAADDEMAAFELYEPIVDSEEKLFVWPLLPSNVRAALKRCADNKRAHDKKLKEAA